MSAASTPPKSLSHLIAPEEDDPWKPGFVPPEVAADSNVYSCNCCGLLGTSHGLHGTALMLRCTGCRAARYCSATCQNEDWAVGGHRAICLETRSRRENLLEGDDRSMFLTPRRLQRQDNSSSTDNDKDTAEQAAIFVRRISTGDKNVVVKKDGKARIVTPQPSIKPNALNLNHGGS